MNLKSLENARLITDPTWSTQSIYKQSDGDSLADFAETFLHAKGLAWAADLLARWPGHAPEAEPTFSPPAFPLNDMIAAE